MLKKVTKKSVALVMLLLTIFSTFSNIVLAADFSSATIRNGGDCGFHLQFWDENQNAWSYIITTYSYYEQNGVQYPAYCLNRDVPGVGVAGEYDVNIHDFMEDVRIWRVVINGYPYQTPQAMGLENQWDAFVATKQAVYCIIYNFDAETRYNGGDARGTAIKNAIINLVNIGRNGTQTPTNTDVQIVKHGNLYADGDFYSQEYCVNSPVESSLYTIIATPGLPEGSQITNLSNNIQSSFGANETFKVRVPKDKLIADIDANIIVRAKCKTYPIFYGATTRAGTQDYVLTFDPFGDLSGETNLNIKTNNGKIQIHKTDIDTKTPIEGVTFELSKEDGTVISNATTNKDGIATFTGLYPAKYTLKEIETNKNYVLSTNEQTVNVEFDKTTNVGITNEHKKGNLKIYKVDKDNKRVVLGNVEFDLFSEELQKVVGTYTTNENGEISIEGLRTGKYKVIEKRTNKWYNLADEIDVEIKWNETELKTIENELKKGQIKIIKVDKDNHEVKLEGVTFEVLDENDNILETLITDKNGEALTSKYAIRDYQKLKIRETSTLQTYELSDKVETAVLEENQIKNITFENNKIYGTVEITKVDSKTKEAIEGVKFGIYNSKDKQIGTLITDKDGKATSKKLTYGNYYIKELDTGSHYYLLNKNTYKFEIKKNGQKVPMTITNDSTDITVDVDKTGTTEIKPGELVHYEFSNVANKSNIYLDNFKWYDYIPTDYVRLQTMTTGTWNQDLTYDVYYKTNKSEDYILRYEDLKTTEDHLLDFTKKIELAEDEYITEVYFDFGKVEIGFQEDVKPTMTCKSFDTLQNGQTFTNKTKTVGTYFELKAEANSKWTTIVHKPEEQKLNVLPKTGN
ncbi:MAG: Cys-Gln thioester bond-forming surface protein [Clostridia bacterium]|nr:Cys-Gln thioester bond-forming surface protein [Clostridia bacterium]